MNKEQKRSVVEEVAAQIEEAEAVFAVDYRGISVPQAADLRVRLGDAGARFRVVKNTLTELAADRAGAEPLKEVLDGPTAFTFVAADGDVALAARALAEFRRQTDLLEFKGGVMAGEALSADEIGALSRLPARDVLHGQLVGMIASPITGLVRGLNALIAGLAIQLKQIADEGMVPHGETAGGDQAGGDQADSDQEAQAAEAADEAEQSAKGEETESSSEESAPAAEETETTESPEDDDGDEKE
jgi:large subunit ribosomal protein L10